MPDSIYYAPGGGRSASMNASLERTYELTLKVETEVLRGPGYVRNAVISLLGGMGSTYSYGTETDTASYLQSVEVVDESEDGFTWTATATYGPNDDGAYENPFAVPPEVSVDWQPISRLTDIDANGAAVINSAYDPFDPPLEREESVAILKVVRNEPDYPFWEVFQRKDSTNNATWNTFPPNTVRITAPKATQQVSSTSGLYYRIEYEFLINPSGWTTDILDKGYREYRDGERRAILVDGQPTQSEVLLNGSGLKMPEGGNPVFISFQPYKQSDFSYWNISL